MMKKRMTNQYLDRLLQTMSPLLLVVLLLLSLSGAAVWAEEPAVPSAGPHLVGDVTLVLGKAWRVTAGERRQAIRVGSPVYETDRIFTEANGHVHIRFVDNALVSVRPGSRLEIVRYDYHAARPEQSSVKFRLEEGVTRAISGEAARNARQRFRLNTPIAAIGVRGTDFVVHANADSTRALVNEGIIVLAPYSIECTADAFGPCLVNAVELSDAQMQLVEIDTNATEPRLIPAPHERDPTGMRDEVQVAIARADTDDGDQQVSNEVYLEGVTSGRVSAQAANLKETPSRSAVPDFTPALPVSTALLTERQLVWGRWAQGLGGQERITLSYNTARVDREVTVGNQDYLLFRPQVDGTRVDQNLGVVRFGLSSAQASYDSASGIVAMQVRGGSLDIDFVDSQFATELHLDHGATGAVNFQASGKISDGGYFNSRSAEQIMAGAVSLDGQEAGYFFEKQLQDGAISGLTLWDAR